LLLALLLAGPVFAWGPLGHRVSAQLAQPYLTDNSRTAIQKILGDQSLAEASFWADQMRGNPSSFWQDQAGAYHYVTVPIGKTYAEAGAPDKGDAVTALADFRLILQDPDASLASKQLALRFSLHIIQDLHQPFHVGNGRDRGATRIRVRFDGKNQTLHWVWDTGMMSKAEPSEAKWIAYLSARMSAVRTSRWFQSNPETWIGESAALRQTIYPPENSISEDYILRHLPELELRLQQSAIRTAAYMNALFD